MVIPTGPSASGWTCRRAPVYCFTRIRNVDGEPLILETSYPQYIYPNLTREMVQTHSFYSLLYHVGITPFSAEDTYESVIPGCPRASLLGVEPGSCAFYHQRRTPPRMAAFMSTPAAISAATGSVWTYTCRKAA